MDKETFFLKSGHGVIDLKGSDFDCIIYFNQSPYALNWCDLEGSVGQLLMRTSVKGFRKNVRQLDRVLREGLNDQLKISDQIYPILQLFKYGTLVLGIYEESEWQVIECGENSVCRYYPYAPTLVMTQPSTDLDEDTVVEYECAIRDGQRPLVLTTSVEGGWCEFVLDGHHKLKAYESLDVPVNILNIEKPKSQLPIDEALSAFQDKQTMEMYKRIRVEWNR